MADKKLMEQDPVCGMQVDPASARARIEHGGRTYFFCCAGCAQKFESAPEKYLRPRPASAGPALTVISPAPTRPLAVPAAPTGPQSRPPESGTEYTCPMHPEVITR